MIKVALLLLFVALSIADIVTTMKGLKRADVEEASPIPRFLFSLAPPPVVMGVLKAALTLFLAYVLYARATAPWHDALRWAVAALLLGGAVFVLVSNIRALRSQG